MERKKKSGREPSSSRRKRKRGLDGKSGSSKAHDGKHGPPEGDDVPPIKEDGEADGSEKGKLESVEEPQAIG